MNNIWTSFQNHDILQDGYELLLHTEMHSENVEISS